MIRFSAEAEPRKPAATRKKATEESAADFHWSNQELRTCSRKIGFTPNWDDGVDQRRAAERAEKDTRARLRHAEPSFVESIIDTPVRVHKHISTNQRLIADMLGVDPYDMNWSWELSKMTGSHLVEMARACLSSPNVLHAWNISVSLKQTRYASSMRTAPRNTGPISDFHCPKSLGWTAKQSRNAEITAWMKAAEKGSLANRVTKCQFTGASLVKKEEHFGRHTWRLVKDFHGMGIEQARHAVSAAAIIAGLVKGTIKGEAPDIVNDLAINYKDWSALVIKTRHPYFYAQVDFLNRAKPDFEFKSTQESNYDEWAAWTKVMRELEKVAG